MKNTGIWLDKKKAFIVDLENNTETVRIIDSNIEIFNVTSNKHIGGSQEVAKDSKYLEREKQQFKTYFNNIAQEVKDADALVIFGPAETYEKFARELGENHKASN